MRWDVKSIKFAEAISIIVCMTMVVSGTWAIDISVSAMATSSYIGKPVLVTSGWWNRNPVLQYHIGLYLVYLSSLIISFIAIYEILRRDA